MASRRRRTGKKQLVGLVVFLALCLVISIGELTGSETLPTWGDLFGEAGLAETPAEVTGDGLAVRVLDVGQGLSVLVQTGEQNVLIDGAERSEAASIVSYLEGCGVKKLDLVIATHPHSDHIGGLADILEEIPADRIIMPKLPSELVPTSSVYQNLLRAVQREKISASYAKPGQSFDLGGGAALTVLGPAGEYGDLNDWSVVSRITYGSTAFLVTGDAEKGAEQDILSSGVRVSADVLVLGHHGSSTSSCGEFLDAVGPSFAAISCGLDNDYGHPHQETLDRLEERGIEYFRTDLQGTLVFESDGEQVTVQTAK